MASRAQMQEFTSNGENSSISETGIMTENADIYLIYTYYTPGLVLTAFKIFRKY